MTHALKSLIASAMVALSAHAMAGEHANREEAVAMVKKITAAIKADGKEKVIKEVNTPNGKYSDRDMYVTIETVDGLTLANNTAPRTIGKNVLELRDPDGKYFIKERNEALKTKPSVWLDLKWPNPVTLKTDDKVLYAERVNDLIFTASVLKQ